MVVFESGIRYESFDSFQLAEFDFFLRNASHNRFTLTLHRVSSAIELIVKYVGL